MGNYAHEQEDYRHKEAIIRSRLAALELKVEEVSLCTVGQHDDHLEALTSLKLTFDWQKGQIDDLRNQVQDLTRGLRTTDYNLTKDLGVKIRENESLLGNAGVMRKQIDLLWNENGDLEEKLESAYRLIEDLHSSSNRSESVIQAQEYCIDGLERDLVESHKSRQRLDGELAALEQRCKEISAQKDRLEVEHVVLRSTIVERDIDYCALITEQYNERRDMISLVGEFRSSRSLWKAAAESLYKRQIQTSGWLTNCMRVSIPCKESWSQSSWKAAGLLGRAITTTDRSAFEGYTIPVNAYWSVGLPYLPCIGQNLFNGWSSLALAVQLFALIIEKKPFSPAGIRVVHLLNQIDMPEYDKVTPYVLMSGIQIFVKIQFQAVESTSKY